MVKVQGYFFFTNYEVQRGWKNHNKNRSISLVGILFTTSALGAKLEY